jgi:WD40 repeat protein
MKQPRMRLSARVGLAAALALAAASAAPRRAAADTTPRRSVAFSPDSKLLAYGTASGEVKVWDVETGQRKATLSGHKGQLRFLSFSPDTRTLASGDSVGDVKLWDLPTGRLRRTWTLSVVSPTPTEPVTYDLISAAFSPDGKLLVSTAPGVVRLWNTETEGVKWSREEEGISGFPFVFSPDGKTLASWGNWRVILVDARTGQTIRTLQTNLENITAGPVYSPGGRTFAVGSSAAGLGRDYGAVDVWDTQTGKSQWSIQVPELGSTDIRWVAFSPDGRKLAAGGGDATGVWNAQTGKLRRRLPDSADVAAFLPDSRVLLLVAREDEGRSLQVKLWDLQTGQIRRTLGGLPSAFLSPDGRTVASVSPNGTVDLWEVRTGTRRRSSLARSLGTGGREARGCAACDRTASGRSLSRPSSGGGHMKEPPSVTAGDHANEGCHGT